MPNSRSRNRSVKKVQQYCFTHVLIQTKDDLITGTEKQLEAADKENLAIGMVTNLIINRKRIRGTIIYLGTLIKLVDFY